VSNYLQSKGKFFYLYVCFSLAISPAFAIHPQKEAADHDQSTVNIQSQPDKSYWPEAQAQIGKLYQSVSTNAMVLKTEKEASSQANDIRQKVVNKVTNTAKGFVYDPEHPEKLFGQLIALYSFVTDIEKQCIPYGEKILGSKNQLVIKAKEKYSEQVQYLNAMKQQKLQAEQMRNSK
jgi:hypothetical protein